MKEMLPYRITGALILIAELSAFKFIKVPTGNVEDPIMALFLIFCVVLATLFAGILLFSN